MFRVFEMFGCPKDVEVRLEKTCIEWSDGIQGSGYRKGYIDSGEGQFPLAGFPGYLYEYFFRQMFPLDPKHIVGWDTYALYYPVGSFIAPHKDPMERGFEHWRLNYVIEQGDGTFFVQPEQWVPVPAQRGDGILFRPDILTHSVSQVSKPRLAVSFGAKVEDYKTRRMSTVYVDFDKKYRGKK